MNVLKEKTACSVSAEPQSAHECASIIHILRKQNANDPINVVSGTTGITGTVDNSFVLKEPKRGSGHATLYCTGRDIEYREIELMQDRQNHCWNLESDSLENPDALLDDMVRVFSECIKT